MGALKTVFLFVAILLLVPVVVSAESSSFGDVQQAQKFLASLPPSCSGSYSVSSNGSVSVSYSCKNQSGQVASGTIDMRDGKVVDVK